MATVDNSSREATASGATEADATPEGNSPTDRLARVLIEPLRLLHIAEVAEQLGIELGAVPPPPTLDVPVNCTTHADGTVWATFDGHAVASALMTQMPPSLLLRLTATVWRVLALQAGRDSPEANVSIVLDALKYLHGSAILGDDSKALLDAMVPPARAALDKFQVPHMQHVGKRTSVPHICAYVAEILTTRCNGDVGRFIASPGYVEAVVREMAMASPEFATKVTSAEGGTAGFADKAIGALTDMNKGTKLAKLTPEGRAMEIVREVAKALGATGAWRRNAFRSPANGGPKHG